MGKIIADTNIWYRLGRDGNLFEKIKFEPLSPTYPVIMELSFTENIINRENSVRKAIQQVMHFQANTIFEPPFTYIGTLSGNYQYNVDDIRQPLLFTAAIANGDKIEDSKRNDFIKLVKDRKQGFEAASTMFNERADEIRKSIVNKQKHAASDSIPITASFINWCVEKSTENKCNLDGFDLSQIELLTRTMDRFLKTMELSLLKMTANDWFDLSILSYVGPNDKFWTEEKKWIQLIKEAGCEQFLYIPPQ